MLNNQDALISENPLPHNKPNNCSYPANIGRLIEAELHRQGRTVTWLSRQLHCNRRNIYDIFERQSLDSELLFRISRVLGRDFFKIFSRCFIATGDSMPDYDETM